MVRLSEKHGVNPTMVVCLYCRRPSNVIGLVGRLPGDEQAARYSILDQEPCDECKGYMKKGIVIYEVTEMKEVEVLQGKGHRAKKVKAKLPQTTGTLVVVAEKFVNRVFPELPELFPEGALEAALEHRMVFMSTQAWDMLGLPREDFNHEEQEGETT